MEAESEIKIRYVEQPNPQPWETGKRALRFKEDNLGENGIRELLGYYPPVVGSKIDFCIDRSGSKITFFAEENEGDFERYLSKEDGGENTEDLIFGYASVNKGNNNGGKERRIGKVAFNGQLPKSGKEVDVLISKTLSAIGKVNLHPHINLYIQGKLLPVRQTDHYFQNSKDKR